MLHLALNVADSEPERYPGRVAVADTMYVPSVQDLDQLKFAVSVMAEFMMIFIEILVPV